MAETPWTELVSKVSIDWSRYWLMIAVSPHSHISRLQGYLESGAYVEAGQASAVSVKGLVVELHKLLCTG